MEVGHDRRARWCGQLVGGRLPVRTFVARIALHSLMLLVPLVALIEINRALGPGTLGRFFRGRV